MRAPASFKRRITSRDPVQTATAAYYYGRGAQPYDGPGFTLPIGIVSTDQLFDSRSLLQTVLRSTLTPRPSVLKGGHGALQVSPEAATVTVRVPCRYANLGCGGILALGPSVRANAARPPRIRSLGFAQFVVPRGRGSATVKIPLNVHGRSPALAHKTGASHPELDVHQSQGPDQHHHKDDHAHQRTRAAKLTAAAPGIRALGTPQSRFGQGRNPIDGLEKAAQSAAASLAGDPAEPSIRNFS